MAGGDRQVRPTLELVNASARLGAREVVRDVSLQIAAGETVAVVGPSGAGKSSLARLALGLVPASSGVVRFEGRELAAVPARERRALRGAMQLIYQDPQRSLDPTMTVAEIIAEGVEIHTRGLPWRRRAWRLALARTWLERVGLAGELAHRFPARLSGGQRQRVAIARALALAPRLLVADEPTASLDAAGGAEILALMFAGQAERQRACLVISHSLAQISARADRIAVMDQGRIVELAPARQLLASPAHPLTRLLLAATPPWPPFGAHAAER